MLLRNGTHAVYSAAHYLLDGGLQPDWLVITALSLNVAMVLFGFDRYRAVRDELLEYRKAEASARHLAETDPLTGCLNRRSIGPATNALIAAAQARGDTAAFLMIDLDNFKQINDTAGHANGDLILQETAARIARLLPDGGLVARLGGDEFACVLAFDPHHPTRIDQLTAALITAVAAPHNLENWRGEVTVSVGITRADSQLRPGATTADAAALLHQADIAMYQAKKRGRNRHMWFEETMESELRYRSELEAGIRAGLRAREFVPYYEQQIHLDSGEIAGFEMLARWISPSFGMVGPEVFIPIAEEIGVITELSEQLIEQALTDASEWDPSLTLSVNISPLQLRDPWFSQRLLRMMVAANFPPQRLEIEITESCVHQNLAGVHALVTSLKNQGVGISLDDFGTGYSSLTQLRELPFDRLKIDRSFVAAITQNTDSNTIVETIASLGKGLGLPITAEGVETQEVLDKLKHLGSFKGQGWLYGRPMPADEARALLAERHQLRSDALARAALEHTSTPDMTTPKPRTRTARKA